MNSYGEMLEYAFDQGTDVSAFRIPQVVQRFVYSKSSKNQVLKCTWTAPTEPGGKPICFIERAFNIHSMYQSKIDLNDRIHTFESANSKGPSCYDLDSNIPNFLHVEIDEALLQIRDHFMSLNIAMKSGTFYFKFDKAD